MVLIFIGHLVIAVTFIVSLYIGATYSSILYEINEIKRLQAKIEHLLTKLDLKTVESDEDLAVTEKKIAYCKKDYNETVKRFYSRKTSLFAIPVLVLFKKLNQDFAYWN